MFNPLNKIFMQPEFKYADLLDDEAFKLVFGQESTKDVMIEFLNQVITDKTIVDVDFIDKEMHPYDRDKKTSVYDLFCKTDDGSRIIVELQKRKQDSYAERMLYYSMHQILKQVEAGADNFDFYPIYVISILNFTIESNNEITDVKTVYRLFEEKHHTPLTTKVTYIFIELPKFSKKINELDGNILEGMYFCLKNMQLLQSRPEALTHKVFDKIFKVSEFLEMDEETRAKILDNMTTERDLRNQFAYARKEGHALGRAEGHAEGHAEGRAEGHAEGRAEVAHRMLKAGMAIQQIAEFTQLSIEEIESLQD